MVIFLNCRWKTTNDVLRNLNLAQDNMVNCVTETVANYQLFEDFSQREAAMTKFNEMVKKNNDGNKSAGLVMLNNRYFATWVALGCSMIWTIVGGTLVIEGIH